MNTKGLMFPKPKDKDSKKEKKIYKMKIRSSKRAKACDIPIAVKKKVLVRDKGFCVVGIEQNVVCMCINCHNAYDNGKDKKKVKMIHDKVKKYLKRQYKGWKEDNLYYKKGL